MYYRCNHLDKPWIRGPKHQVGNHCTFQFSTGQMLCLFLFIRRIFCKALESKSNIILKSIRYVCKQNLYGLKLLSKFKTCQHCTQNHSFILSATYELLCDFHFTSLT